MQACRYKNKQCNVKDFHGRMVIILYEHVLAIDVHWRATILGRVHICCGCVYTIWNVHTTCAIVNRSYRAFAAVMRRNYKCIHVWRCCGLTGSHKLHACRLASRKIPSDSLEVITRSWKDRVSWYCACILCDSVNRYFGVKTLWFMHETTQCRSCLRHCGHRDTSDHWLYLLAKL